MFLILWTTIVFANPEINWYTADYDKSKSVLEVCIDGDCHRLVHGTENSDKQHIEDWAMEIIEADSKIKNSQKGN